MMYMRIAEKRDTLLGLTTLAFFYSLCYQSYRINFLTNLNANTLCSVTLNAQSVPKLAVDLSSYNFLLVR